MKSGNISQFMTNAPHTINSGQTLEFALQTMKELNIRHLPVMESSRLIGMLSERDIRFLESFEKIELGKLKVADACSNDPYSVEKDTPLAVVCREMAERKLSSAMVVDAGKLAGIFTWIDALKIIANQ